MWSDFLAWVSAPAAYNWITLIGVVAAMFTALATGYSANADRLRRKDRVSAEWVFEIQQDSLLVHAEIRNGTQSTLDGDRFTASGPVADILGFRGGRAESKHESWPSNVCPCQIKVAPGEKQSVSFVIRPDPVKLRQLASSRIGSPRAALAKVVWSLFGWKIGFGPKFSITCRLRRRSSPMRPIRLTASSRIYAPAAMKMADTIEAKADKT